MSDDADLSLVSTDSLIEELQRRYDGLLVVREKHPTKGSADVLYDWHGGISRCIGLAVRAQARLTEKADADPHDMDAEGV